MSAKTVEERVLEMRFDNAQFERGISKTMSSVKKFKRELDMDGAAKGFDALDRAVDAVRLRFSALEVMGVTALANITNSAVNAGKRVLKALTLDPVKSGLEEYETQINAVQTILANTSSKGTTLEQVNAALDELNRYADMTIYNFTEMSRNIGTFTAAGVDLETSVGAIKGIANLAAVSGSTSQQASTAMYQLSQALAAGTVKLQDWNSVVNAGMGGQVFQEALKDTARVHGIAIDQMIADQGSFRETLQKGWLSSDILTETLQKFTGDLTKAQLLEMGYTEAQTAAILEMGKTASDAATKVKTFTQLIDTTKEAVQSGWTESWETIIGDFEEAKGLWTGISDVLSDMINASANARNELLSGGLDSGWSKFLNEGSADAVAFKESIVEAALAHGGAIEDLAANTDSFEDSLKQGWLTADILAESLESLSKKTSSLSDEELKSLGLTRQQADALENLNQSVKDGAVNIEDYAKQIGRLSGRENLIAAFWNTWDALFAAPKEAGDLVGVVTAVKEAFRDIFPATTSEQLYQFTENLKNLTEKFKMSEETAKNVKNTFKGFFAVLDIGKQGLSAMARLVSLLFGGLGKLSGGLLGATGNLGEWLTNVDEAIRENKFFEKAIQGTASALQGWAREIAGIPQVQRTVSKLEGWYARSLKNVSAYFDGGIDRIQEFITRVRALDHISLSDFGHIFKDFSENVLKYFLTLDGRFNSFRDVLSALKGRAELCFDGVGDSADALRERIARYFTDMGGQFGSFMGHLLEFGENARKKFNENIGLGEILTVGMGAGLIVVAKQIGSALEILSGPLSDISGVVKSFDGLLKSCSKAVNAFALETKTKALKNAAVAIAILAGSIALLTVLDQQKLWSSVGALGALAAGIVGVCAALGALEKVGDFKKVGASMTGIAASLFILITAMKKLEKMDGDRLWGNMGVLGLLATGLATIAAVMGRISPQLTKGSVFLLAFASSMHLLIGALKSMEKLDAAKSGQAVPLLITAVAGLGVVAAACGNLKMGSAAGILAVAASLSILTGTFQRIASLDAGRAKGNADVFLAILASFAGIMAASKLAGAHAAKAGMGILAMSAALLLLVPAIKGLGKIDPLDMERASTAIAKLLLVFAAVTAASQLAGANAVKAGTMLLLMSGAITVLAGVMVLLSHIEPEGLDRALGAIIALEAVFGALIAVTHLAKDCKGTLMMLSVSAGLLATALGGLSMINADNLRAASGSLSLVMGAFALVVASTALAQKANSTILVMTGTVAALASILGLLASLTDGSVLSAAQGLSTLLLSLTGAMVIAGKAGTISAGAYTAIGAMTLVTAGLAAILGVLSYMNVESTMENAASLSTLLLSLSGACLILSKVGAAGTAAFVGIGALSATIAAMGGLMAGIGALCEYFPDLDKFLNHGIAALEGIGYGLGAFAGNIAGGFLAGTTAGLPAIGENLSGFMTSAKPFFDNVSGIDPAAMTGVEAMADAILLLSKADILNSLTSWLTGGTSLTAFGRQLASFGGFFRSYADEVSGIGNMDIVSASASAAKTLAEFASATPNSGGLVARFTGENSLSAFAAELVPFGKAFSEYARSIDGVSPDTVTASASSAKSLAEFAAALPNAGGLLSALTGDNTLSAFAKELKSFGPAFAEYASAMGGVSNMDVVTASAAAAKSLAEFAASIPNSGGLLAWIAGDNSLSAFAAELVPFGSAFAEYARAIDGITPETVTASAAAAQSLAALAQSLPNSGGLAGLFAGNNNIDDFGVRLAAFGSSFKMYYDSISGISDTGRMANVTDALRALIEVARDGGSEKSLKNFGSFLQGLAETRIDDFIGAFDGAASDIRKAGETLGDNLETGIRRTIPDFRKAGQDAAQGFINGIRSKKSTVSSAGTELGSAVVSATRRALDSHSPSVEEYKAGQDAGEGLALGVASTGKKVADTAKSVAGGIVDATKSALDLDKWIGKTTKSVEDAGKAETKVAQETASAAQKSSKAKTQAAKSAYEVFLDYIKEERYYNRLSTEEELEQYKKVRDTYVLTAEERKKVSREIYTLEKQLMDESYQHSMDWIEQEKYYQRLSLEEELAAYERVQARHKQGTEEWKKLEREKYRVQNELAEAAYQHSMDWIEQEEAYDRLGTAAKLAAYTRVQQRYEKGSDKRKKLDREVYNLQKQLWQAQKDYYADVEKAQSDYHEKRLSLEQEYADKVKSVNEQLEKDIQDLNDAYASALDSRADSLYKAYGLFDAVSEKEEVSSEELMGNLMDQVHEFESWRDTLDALSARGLDPGLVEELQEMGPSAIAQLKALSAMSDSELDKYASLWGIKHALARRQATEELEGLRVETNSKIAGLRQDAAAELDEYRAVWQQQMSELESTTARQLEDLKTTFEKTVGILPEYTEAEFTEMVETANSILGQAGWTELGEQIVAGLSNGIEAQKEGFVQGLTDLANAGVEAVKTTLDIHSPSGVFDKLGNFTGMGFINALSSYVGKAYDVGQNMAESARDGLSFAANAMADVLERDPEPVIRPVLDLSNLDAGSRQLDTLFSREYALRIQNAGISRNRMDEIGSLSDTLREGLSSGDDRIVSAIQELRGDMAALSDRVGRMQMVLDTGALVGEIAPAVDQELGNLANWRGRNM